MEAQEASRVTFLRTMAVLASDGDDGERIELVIQRSQVTVPTKTLLRLSVERIVGARNRPRRVADQVEMAVLDGAGTTLNAKKGLINGSDVLELDVRPSASEQREVTAVVKIVRRSSVDESMFFSVGAEEPRISCRAELVAATPEMLELPEVPPVTAAEPSPEVQAAPPDGD